MIFFGYGCESICRIPIGRHCASGLSLLLSACRFVTSSFAHGWYGASPSGVLPPTLPKIFLANGLPRPRPPPAAGGAGWAGAVARAAACPDPGVGLRPSITGGAQSGHGAVSQTPERSGLPSAVRGAGALRSTLPSGGFG